MSEGVPTALRMFIDNLTTLTNVTGVRCVAARVLLNGVRYDLDWEPGKGYVIAESLTAVQP